jgi:hypothetical protein
MQDKIEIPESLGKSLESAEFTVAVQDFLQVEKVYPEAEILSNVTLGDNLNSIHEVDIAIFDSRRKSILALIEVKKSFDHKILRQAVANLLHSRRVIGKPHIPLYLFFEPLANSGKKFNLVQVLSEDENKDVYPSTFPSYDSLVSLDQTSEKTAAVKAVKTAVDTFHWTCVLLSIVVSIVLGLDMANVVELSIKQLSLAGIASVLLILPFAAKLKMLGVEFERNNTDSSKTKTKT